MLRGTSPFEQGGPHAQGTGRTRHGPGAASAAGYAPARTGQHERDHRRHAGLARRAGCGRRRDQSAKAAADATVQAAEAATLAAAGTPGAPAALAAEIATKNAVSASMGSMITGASGGADIHNCLTPVPPPVPHGLGVVIDGSQTVLINNLPACRLGDTIIEALGPPNKIIMGLPTVIIGG